MASFNNNYLDRTAGLRNFIAPIPPLGGVQSVEEKSPLGKFLDFATEAFTPGHVQQNEEMAGKVPYQPQEVPFRDTGFGSALAGMFPNTFGRVFENQRNGALADYLQSAPSDPVQQLRDIARLDPRNAEKYAAELLQYTEQQNDPLRKAQTEAAQLSLASAKKEQESRSAMAEYLKSLSSPAQPDGGTFTPPSGSLPIGAQNNNYLNIRNSEANNWQGQIGANKGFAVFATPEEGFRAAAKTLDSYARNGINTIDGIVQRWAPEADGNNPELYAAFVSRETGIPRNVQIDPANPAIQSKLLAAMQKMEVGPEKAAPQEVVDAGISLAHGGQKAQKPQSDLARYQEIALKLGALDPQNFADNALAAFLPSKSSAPQTKGLPKGYMWQGDKAVPVPGLPQTKDFKLPKGVSLPQGTVAVPDDSSSVGFKVVPIPGAQRSSTDFKEYQLKPAAFAQRMVNVSPAIDKIEEQGNVITPAADAISAIPSLGLGEYIGRSMRDSEQQSYRNAADEWIRAKLRKESGAVIGADEMRKEYQTYFPVPGDTPQVITQKRALRKNAEQSLIKESNGAYETLFQQPAPGESVDDLLQYMTPEERALFKK